MSRTELHIGKLRKVVLKPNETIEQWCEAKAKSLDETDLEEHDNWEEFLKSNYQEKVVFINDIIWEVIENVEVGEDVNLLSENEDGTLNYVMSFYNGGCCLGECLEDSLNKFESKLDKEIKSISHLKPGDFVLCTYGYNDVLKKPFTFLYEFGYYTECGCVVYTKGERNLQDSYAFKLENIKFATPEDIKNNFWGH